MGFGLSLGKEASRSIASSARFRAVMLFMARITCRLPSKTTGSALTSSHRRLSLAIDRKDCLRLDVMDGLPGVQHRLERVADGARRTMGGRPASRRIGRRRGRSR